MDLSRIRVAEDGTHHVLDGHTLYPQRFRWVQKYRPPGLAPAGDDTGAFHIDLNGRAAYERRFLRTFGFYEDRAAVQTEAGWGHVDAAASPVYPPTFSWVGNFQEGRCPVRARDGSYFHIQADGSPTYPDRYRYAGDFREGAGCVQREDGLYIHIDLEGRPVHNRAFLDLRPFHKGHAAARDSGGWHHIDRGGRGAYVQRYIAVEPFYNGYARVESRDGALAVIDERGRIVFELRRGSPPSDPRGRWG